MAEDRFTVGVVAIKRKLKSAWVSHAWAPLAVLPAAPAATPWTLLSREGEDETWYAGPAEVTLHSGETAHYRDNLSVERPSLWVALRPTAGEELDVALVTADPYEGEALAESADLLVEAVPMPPDIVERVAAFFAAHHVERPFFKRKRDRAGTGGGPRPPVPEEGEP
ncbi:DUF3305 domain-containing protein [Salinarimonas soli]|uniref:DUF3305 domain-containing protein n=1 Tax=Salinarimonas soli TaxID=1638099 RepID=A0A5B2VFR9_9HYPH|nr:DUF3305 domain-containing protein [Salinarimonas soli]KAA2237159.1 DUF3305 domain-containing protein [Salinarimonas soli]